MKSALQGVHEDYGGMCIIRGVALIVSILKPASQNANKVVTPLKFVLQMHCSVLQYI